jgi:hypothetical protein
VDCDQDGLPECPSDVICDYYHCSAPYVDECAPPGELTYFLYWVDCEELSEKPITVEDVGQECVNNGADHDCAEAEVDGGTESDESSGGCATAPARPTAPLMMLMLLLGVVALLVGRGVTR